MTFDEHLRRIFGDRLAPDGSLVRDNFARWFGTSKVRSEDGGPIVVYHGTNADIDRFDDARLGRATGAAWSNLGHFFTGDAKLASDFAKGKNWHKPGAAFKRGGNVIPVYLALQNPLHVPASRMAPLSGSPDKILALRKEAMAAGHDGVIIGTWFDSFGFNDTTDELATPQYVAFHAHQIKSAVGNSGAFNPNDPDMSDRNAVVLANAMRAKQMVAHSSSLRQQRFFTATL